MSELPDNEQRDGLTAAAYQGAVWTAVVAACFSVVVAALLVVNHVRSQALDVKDSEQMAEMKKALGQAPGDEALQQRLRQVDLALRREHFRRAAFATRGAWLLAGGVLVFLIALKSAATLREKLPMPQGHGVGRGEQARAARLGRRTVAAVGLLLAVGAGVLGLTSASRLPAAPVKEEMRGNWPRFRGADGLGISAHTNVPTSWDGRTGANIRWKAPVPLWAPNSPVVWGDRVFLSGATKTRREVYCYDAASGRLLWQQPVAGIAGSPAEPFKVMDAAGYAASTMATDGQRAYAIFANGDLAAFDFSGQRVWARSLGLPDNSYGHASSLLTWRDRLIVLMDQGLDDDDKAKLYALDAATGKAVWETTRKMGSTWATPVVAPTPQGDQIITVGVPWVHGYDAATGAELWRVDILDGEPAPSPVFADGLVFAASAYSVLAAIKPDGQGDVTGTHVVWTKEDGLPDTCSPLATGELVILLTSEGIATCYDARDGKKLWEHEITERVVVQEGDKTREDDRPMHFLASPSLVGDKVYLVSDKGVAVLLAAARGFRELGRAPLGEEVVATPAFADGRIYIRGKKHLFCIGKRR